MGHGEQAYLQDNSQKIAVEYAHIISKYSNAMEKAYHANIYYEIEYKPIDEDEVHIGFGSYYLDLVQEWLKTEFDIRG